MEPERAARLEAAYQTIRERLIKEDMERVVELLSSNSPLKALQAEEDIRDDLNELIRILEGARKNATEDLDKKLENLRKAISSRYRLPAA